MTTMMGSAPQGVAGYDDPMAELAEMARRQQAEKDALAALSAAKVRIVTGRAVTFDERNVHEKRKAMGVSAFFGSGVRRTKYVPDWTIDTACTNGKTTFYRPGYVAPLEVYPCCGLVTHEAGHDLLGHHVRLLHLPDDVRNVCFDLALNEMMASGGFELPKGALRAGVPFMFRGQMIGPFPPMLAAEQYAGLLPDFPTTEEGGEGSGEDWSGPWKDGRVSRPVNQSPAAIQQAEQQAKQALAQAYQEAKQRGELPAGMDQFLGDLLAPKIDWRNVVREFLTASAKVDVSWAKPSRKWLAQGHYLPSLSGQSLGHVVLLNDTSGSLDSMEWRTKFRSEVEGIMDGCPPSRVTVMHHDSVVQRTETWEPGDGDIPWHPKGGGGTDHRPCFDAIANLDEPADLVIALTDLCSVFPANGPDCPVLWATTEDRPIPWGRKVVIAD